MNIEQKLWDAYHFYKENKAAVAAYMADDGDLLTSFSAEKSYEENIEHLKRNAEADMKSYALEVDLRFFAAEILCRVIGELPDGVKITDLADAGLPDSEKGFFNAYFKIKNKNDIETSIGLDLDHLRLVIKEEFSKDIDGFEERKKGDCMDKGYVATREWNKVLDSEADIDALVERLQKPAQAFLKNFAEFEDKQDEENNI